MLRQEVTRRDVELVCFVEIGSLFLWSETVFR